VRKLEERVEALELFALKLIKDMEK
jgi:hypothetical protein